VAFRHSTTTCQGTAIMNRIKQSWFFAAVLLSIILGPCPVLHGVCLAQDITWRPTNGPYGGRIFQLACTPEGAMLAGIENFGLFRSTDDGETWQQTSLTSQTVDAFAIDGGGRLFAGVYSASGVFISSDDGLTWTQSNAGLNQDAVVSLAITSSDHIFAGTFYNGVFRSTDGGTHWTPSRLPIVSDFYSVRSMCVDSSDNVYAAVAGNGLLRSSDDGETWTQAGFEGADIQSLICASSTEILAAPYGGIYRSTDSGGSWTELFGNITRVNRIALNRAGHIFAFTDGGLVRSVDGGLTWITLEVGLHVTRFLSGAISSKGYIYAGSDGDGVARSTDNGATWEEVNTGLTGNSVWMLASTTGGVTVAGTDRGLYFSDDKGETWTLSEALPRPVMSVAATASGLVFAGTGTGVYRSSDGAFSWERVDKGFAWTYIYSICADASGDLFAGTSLGQVYRSTDAGESWTQVLETGRGTYSLASSGRGEVFVGTYGLGIYRSTDRGRTWSQASNGVPDGINDRIIVSIAVVRTGDILAGSADGKVLRSTDNGTSWTTLIDTAGFVRSIVEDPNGTVYAGTQHGVYYSVSHGDSWLLADSGLGRSFVQALSFDNDGYLFAGLSYGGIYRSREHVRVEIPTSFRLMQNYPNPFNLSTIIGFSLPRPRTVNLTVYNLLGQEVATLASGYLSAGKYEVRWSANAPSGIYFYRLQSSAFKETRKMVLLK
jgi:photosystem II stability/assembly factor-like uncharacterized protein